MIGGRVSEWARLPWRSDGKARQFMAPNILITGMSGTGKSSVITALTENGLGAYDLDADGFSNWVPCEGNPTGARQGFDWHWNEQKLAHLLSGERETPLFVAGCAPNMGRFLTWFDRIVVLTAPPETMFRRVMTRTRSDYGKSDPEWRQIVENMKEFEPKLRRIATDIIDTELPLSTVVDRVRETGCAPSHR